MFIILKGVQFIHCRQAITCSEVGKQIPDAVDFQAVNPIHYDQFQADKPLIYHPKKTNSSY